MSSSNETKDKDMAKLIVVSDTYGCPEKILKNMN